MSNSFARHLRESVNMQSLAHQKGRELFTELLPLFKEIREIDPKDDAGLKSKAAEISKVVKDRLNVTSTLKVEMKDKDAAYMHIPRLDKNHPLLNLNKRKYLSNAQLRERLKESLKETEGGIDSSTGRAFGFISKIDIDIVIGIDYLKEGSVLTPEETTAVYLHELGHAWTYFYMLGSTIRTNVVIHAAMYDYEFGKNTQADADRLYQLEGVTGMRLDDKVKTASQGNEAVAISILNEQVKMQRSEFGTTGFDNSGAEAIADQFVARQGAGVHIVTGLDKLHKQHAIFKRTTKIMLQLLWVIGNIKLFGTPLIIGIFLSDPTAGDYDDPYKRAKRVREQIVSSLRDKTLTKEERRTRLEELTIIDEVMDGVRDNEPLFDFIWRRVVEGGSSRMKAKLNQERLESLINNDVYVLGSVLEINN